jgi:Ser/Thr protein kinase RdoA (MazF antagonist)
LNQIAAAAGQFVPQGEVLDIQEYGRGNVHDTFLVTVGHVHPTGSPEVSRFILQRLNTRVFRRPEAVMANMRVVTEHVRRRLKGEAPSAGRGFELPRVLLTRNGQDHWMDPGGSFWRALSFIEAARTFDTIQDPRQAQEVGFALGRFHYLLSDLAPHRLADTLPGFHDTPDYLRHYDAVLAKFIHHRPSAEVDYAIKFISSRRTWAAVLEDAKTKGQLQVRVIHGDPKVNNVLLDAATGRAMSMIDLDTAKPGLVHYDVGDGLRSGGNPLGEETEDWEAVRFDPDLGRAILQGYFYQARGFLTGNDYRYFYDAVRLIAFELGLRFFTDYLEGNVYFKARSPEHNLVRALVQFKLTESIEAQAETIQSLIRDLI